MKRRLLPIGLRPRSSAGLTVATATALLIAAVAGAAEVLKEAQCRGGQR
jgi:hypothetical protein